MRKITLILVSIVLSLLLVGCSFNDYGQMWTDFSFEKDSYEMDFAPVSSQSNVISVENMILEFKIEDFFETEIFTASYNLDDYTPNEDNWYQFTIPVVDVDSSSNLGTLTYEVFSDGELLESYSKSTNILEVEDKYSVMYDYAFNYGEEFDDNEIGMGMTFPITGYLGEYNVYFNVEPMERTSFYIKLDDYIVDYVEYTIILLFIYSEEENIQVGGIVRFTSEEDFYVGAFEVAPIYNLSDFSVNFTGGSDNIAQYQDSMENIAESVFLDSLDALEEYVLNEIGIIF